MDEHVGKGVGRWARRETCIRAFPKIIALAIPLCRARGGASSLSAPVVWQAAAPIPGEGPEDRL